MSSTATIDVRALPRAIADFARDGDVVLCMGAGSIGAVAGQIAAEAAQPREEQA